MQSVLIVGGVFLFKKSVHKFNLTAEQLASIKKRKEALEKKEKEQEDK
ncbi:MAG: hypothetical protein ACI89P_001273 [Colwellia sp.]